MRSQRFVTTIAAVMTFLFVLAGSFDADARKKKKKKKKWQPPKYAIGLKVSAIPYMSLDADMKRSEATSAAEAEDREYDMAMSYGLGLYGEYTLARQVMATFDLAWHWARIDGVKINDVGTERDGFSDFERDTMWNFLVGIKFIFLKKGNMFGYAKLMTGYVYYNPDTDNDYPAANYPDIQQVDADFNDETMQGFRLGGGGGVMFQLGTNVYAFVDTDIYYNYFSMFTPPKWDVGDMVGWGLNAGIFVGL